MDVVITYVNGLDPVWRSEYERCTNTPILEKRFRDWGTLKYLFRGIEVNMPFVRKVHLVVSGESQVPEWINRESVNVVLHKDIIPEQFLPTFNCNPIEIHLHCIADLDEEFIYFNDDIFPVLPLKPEDFFRDGKGGKNHKYPTVILEHAKCHACVFSIGKVKNAGPQRERGFALQTNNRQPFGKLIEADDACDDGN